jgi:hypothetical protein
MGRASAVDERYALTEAGLDYLLRRNARIASVLRGEDALVPYLETAAEPDIDTAAETVAETDRKYSAVSDLAASAE